MLGNELLDLGKWKNFMFDQWLAICCGIIEMTATIHFSKITQVFATLKLVDLHFRQRMRLKFDMSLLLFWSTFWLMEKLLNLAQEFSICFQGYRGGDHVIRRFKILNTRELNSSTTKKAFTDSFFDFSTNLLHFFFTPIIPQIFDLNHNY